MNLIANITTPINNFYIFSVLLSKALFLQRMGRILAIDYGTKRTGIAVTDELQLIASGLTTVETHNLMPFIAEYLEKELVDTIVIGQPTQKDGTPSDVEGNIQNFINGFQIKFPNMIIAREEERYTSNMAFQTMIDSGLKKKQRRNKALIDEIAATIILQNYMRYR